MKKPKITITTASFHRNGIGGLGFYVILFTDAENGKMLAHLFEDEGYCAITQLDMLAEGNIAFANGNSWRGDEFERRLRPLLDKYVGHEAFA